MKKLTCLFIFVFYISIIKAQQYWEFGAFGGESHYTGDLTSWSQVLQELHPAGGALIRYNINPWFCPKFNIYYGTISGEDKTSSDLNLKARNLSFQSMLLDIGLDAEFNLTGFKSGSPVYTSSPYLFLGVSVFRFNPEALYQGKWYALQPLCTEGQGTTKYNDREKYALTQISIPFGIGWKKALSLHWNFGIEAGVRITFTDYLDDVSSTYVEPDVLVAAYGQISANLANRTGEVGTYQNIAAGTPRGDPNRHNDWYYFFGFTLTYSVLQDRCARF